MAPPTSAPVSAPTPIQRSCESIRGQIENDGAQLLDRNWKTPNQTVSSSATGPDYNCKRKQELVYPKQKVLEIMDRQTIQDICSCKCGQRGCCSLVVNQHKSNSQYLKDAEIDEIFDHYRLTLAFLLMAKNPMLIFKVKEPGMEFTDNRLQKRPLSDEEATELLDFSPTRKTPIAIYQLRTLQHQFFMPNLSYSQQHHEINPERILPISVEKPIGCGASSVVYKGSILPGYHDFPDIGKEDNKIAIKAINNGGWSMEGSGAGQYQEAEMTKNWDSHKFIAPLQSSIIHENYLLILPLASCDLRELLRKEVPPEYRADKRLAWQRLTNLLSALAHVHGDGETIGYHLDIKPHNILVLKESGDWALTDFGQAHQKIKRTEHDISVTFRHQMATEYSAPGSTSRRSDVFSMGCIGCEIYLWLVDGPENGVVRFRNDRELTRDSVTEYKFWDEYENKLKEPVLKTLERIKNDPEHSRVGVVLESMLNLDGELRITSEAAGKDLADAIEGVYTVPMNPRDGLSPVARSRRPSLVLLPINPSSRPPSPLPTSPNDMNPPSRNQYLDVSVPTITVTGVRDYRKRSTSILHKDHERCSKEYSVPQRRSEGSDENKRQRLTI